MHFDRAGQVAHHHQKTAAVGAKPAGFRSVLRGTPGDTALLYFHMDVGLGMWRLDAPDRRGQTQQVEIVAPSPDATQLWQWCDVTGDAIATAKENNWHTYDAELSSDLEAAWAARRPTVQVVIGITTYIIGDFSGAYAVQRNTASGARRMVRRPYAPHLNPATHPTPNPNPSPNPSPNPNPNKVRRYASGLAPPPPQQLSESVIYLNIYNPDPIP